MGSADLAVLLPVWGMTGAGDFNGSGAIDAGDVASMYSARGPVPEVSAGGVLPRGEAQESRLTRLGLGRPKGEVLVGAGAAGSGEGSD